MMSLRITDSLQEFWKLETMCDFICGYSPGETLLKLIESSLWGDHRSFSAESSTAFHELAAVYIRLV